MSNTKKDSSVLRYTALITNREELGSRAEVITALARRSAKERQSHWKGWAGDIRKTAAFRHELLAKVAYSPAPAAFKPRLLKEEYFETYTRRTYRLQINPDEATEAFLYVPHHANPKSPAPVLIGLHDHGGQFLLGKEKLCDIPQLPTVWKKYQQSGYGGQPPADYFARNGFAVFVIDQFGFGSRALWQSEDEDYLTGKKKWTAAADMRIRLRMRYEQFALHRALLTYGVTEAEITLYDNRRSIDFLETLPEIDTKRIGAFGLSMGSMHTHQLAAFDTRVKASVRVCWTGDFDAMMANNGPRALSPHFLLPGILSKCHLPELVGLSAPGAALMLNGKLDAMYPFVAQEKARRDIAKLTKLQKREGTVKWSYFDGPHSFFPPEQEKALRFFEEHL